MVVTLMSNLKDRPGTGQVFVGSYASREHWHAFDSVGFQHHRRPVDEAGGFNNVLGTEIKFKLQN